jgi:hypothetical protein
MEKQLPQPQEIDSLAQLYDEAQKKADEQQGIADAFGDQLIAMVKEFGQAAPKSDKTKQVQGDVWQVKVTTGQTVQIIPNEVANLRRLLSAASKTAFFKKLFCVEPRYSLNDDAQQFMQGNLPLASRLAEKVRALFMKAVDIKTNSPRLKVEPLKKEKK